MKEFSERDQQGSANNRVRGRIRTAYLVRTTGDTPNTLIHWTQNNITRRQIQSLNFGLDWYN